MKYILSSILFSILIISCASTKEGKDTIKTSDKTEFKDIAKGDSLFAYIRRGACYGMCPTYEIKIYNSGFAELNGIRAIDLLGTYTTTISKDKMHALIEKAKSIGYFEMEDVYDNETVTDLPETKTSIVIDGKRKGIRRRYKFPQEILSFEKMFDEFLDSEKWTQTSPPPAMEEQKK